MNISNNRLQKKKFQKHFLKLKSFNQDFNFFLIEVFMATQNIFIVGGFIRDFINNKDSRDLDIIVDIEHLQLLKILKELECDFSINRHNGIKINFKKIEVDVWTIKNNWAFRNNLIKFNEDYILEGIANGCFYNFDSLVVNIANYSSNIKNYIDFIEKKELSILRKKNKYKSENPTIEANILRAFYIRKIFKIKYSDDTRKYLIDKVAHLNDKYGSSISRLELMKKQYSKYDTEITFFDLQLYIQELYEIEMIYGQNLFLKIDIIHHR